MGGAVSGMNRGRTYIYNETGTIIHTLNHSDVNVNEQDRFGQSVAISGNYAIVGCKDNDDNGSSSGSAYIFNVTTGTEIKKIIGIGIDADDKFGSSVAISGNYAIVGAPFVASTDDGVAYIYGPTEDSLLKLQMIVKTCKWNHYF